MGHIRPEENSSLPSAAVQLARQGVGCSFYLQSWCQEQRKDLVLGAAKGGGGRQFIGPRCKGGVFSGEERLGVQLGKLVPFSREHRPKENRDNISKKMNAQLFHPDGVRGQCESREIECT